MTTYQANAPITPLRQRMQQDMVMRGPGAHTQLDYVRHVRNFAAFLGRPPETSGITNCISMRLAWVRRRSTARFLRCAFCSR